MIRIGVSWQMTAKHFQLLQSFQLSQFKTKQSNNSTTLFLGY
jgi:hypothetical protein